MSKLMLDLWSPVFMLLFAVWDIRLTMRSTQYCTLMSREMWIGGMGAWRTGRQACLCHPRMSHRCVLIVCIPTIAFKLQERRLYCESKFSARNMGTVSPLKLCSDRYDYFADEHNLPNRDIDTAESRPAMTGWQLMSISVWHQWGCARKIPLFAPTPPRGSSVTVKSIIDGQCDCLC